MKKSVHFFSIVLATLLSPLLACGQNLFVTDFGSNIFEFTSGGVRSTFASGLSQANSLAFDSAGDLFVSDSGSGSIYKYTPNGARSTFASAVTGPNAMAFDSAGYLFVASDGDGTIYKFTPGGVQSTFATGLNWPDGLAFDKAGNLFAADSSDDIIYKYTSDKVRSIFATGTGGPAGLAFDSAGNLFDADYWSGNIYKFTPGGVRRTFASGLGVGGPNKLAFDSAGNLFEGNGGSGNVYEFTPGGTRSNFATGLSNASGLAFQPVTMVHTTYSFTNAPLWDLSGIYTNNADTNDVVIPTIDCQANGQINGVRTETYVNGADHATGSGPITGRIFVRAGAVRGSLEESEVLSGVSDGVAYTANVSGKTTTTIVPSSLSVFDSGSIRLCVVDGKCNTLSEAVSLPLPAGMTGDWTLDTDIAADGNKLKGTGTLTLSNGRVLTYQINGSYNIKSEVAKLKLIGEGDATGSHLSLTTRGVGMDLIALKGKVLGQTLTHP